MDFFHHNHQTISKQNSISNQNNQCNIPEVVELNVGGIPHTTSLSTLRKSPNSMLAAMFSGRHRVARDKSGRYFIDRDGHAFHFVLAFLRQGELPPPGESLRVYSEAQFYNIEELCGALERLRPVAGERLRRDFLDQVPNYEANMLVLLDRARHVAATQAERASKLRVCVYKDEGASPDHSCDVSVTFGPWKATPDVYDLIDCIRLDLAGKGYELEQRCIGVCDMQLAGQAFCKRPVFEFKFKWW